MSNSVSLLSRVKWRIGYTLKKLHPVKDRVFHGIINYKPRIKERPEKMITIPTSGWQGLELIIKDIIERTGIAGNKCLEFGVEFGYSSVVFSNYFSQVKGVDIFTGDVHAGFNGDIYDEVKNRLKGYSNITLIQSDYRDFIRDNSEKFDLIHVDIIHTYEATYECGLWAAEHSDCAIFHDTESFPEVKRAVLDIARKTGKKFHNYVPCNGLGIIF